jgi:chromosome segregation ATPase
MGFFTSKLKAKHFIEQLEKELNLIEENKSEIVKDELLDMVFRFKAQMIDTQLLDTRQPIAHMAARIMEMAALRSGDLINQIEERNEQIDDIIKELEDAESNVNSALNQLDTLESSISDLRSELENASDVIEEAKRQDY